MSVINYYNLKFTFERMETMGGINNKDKLVFIFYSCTVIEPGFTEFIPKFKYKVAQKVDLIEIDTLILDGYINGEMA